MAMEQFDERDWLADAKRMAWRAVADQRYLNENHVDDLAARSVKDLYANFVRTTVDNPLGLLRTIINGSGQSKPRASMS